MSPPATTSSPSSKMMVHHTPCYITPNPAPWHPRTLSSKKQVVTSATLPPACVATHSLAQHGQTPLQHTTMTICCAMSGCRCRDEGNVVSATLPLLYPCPPQMPASYTADINHTLELSHPSHQTTLPITPLMHSLSSFIYIKITCTT